jgi:hypothetical protein
VEKVVDGGDGDGDGNVEDEGVEEKVNKTVTKDEDSSDTPVEENTKGVESGGEAKEKTNGTNGLAGGGTEETVPTIKDEITNDTEVAMGTNSSTDLTSEISGADAVVKAGGGGDGHGGGDGDEGSVKGEESKSSEGHTENGKSEAIAGPRRVVVHDAVEVIEGDGTGGKCVQLEWKSNPVNDMIADSLVALLMNVETNPVPAPLSSPSSSLSS